MITFVSYYSSDKVSLRDRSVSPCLLSTNLQPEHSIFRRLPFLPEVEDCKRRRPINVTGKKKWRKTNRYKNFYVPTDRLAFFQRCPCEASVDRRPDENDRRDTPQEFQNSFHFRNSSGRPYDRAKLLTAVIYTFSRREKLFLSFAENYIFAFSGEHTSRKNIPVKKKKTRP